MNSRLVKPSKRRAFSLIEVMVATLILSMISGLIYGSFARSLEIPEYLRNIQERYHRVRIAMDRITTELSMAYISKHVDPSTDQGPHYLFRIKHMEPGDRVDFTSFAHMKMKEDANESDQCEIGYFLEEDPEQRGVYNLMRREQNRIDKDPGFGGKKLVLAPDVVAFHIEAWDELEKEWIKDWDTTQVERFEKLPKILAITLTVKDENDKEVPFYTKTQIMLNTPLDFNSL